MSNFLNKDIFFINSENRLSGTSTDFSYKLDIDPNVEYTHCSLISISIPKTFYSVTDNNYFNLIEDLTSVQVVLPKGNYTRNSFALVLKNLLNLMSPNGWVYNVTYPNITRTVDQGFYNYSVTGNGGLQPSFEIFEHLSHHLGFDKNSTQTFISDELTSTNVTNLNPENTLILHSTIVDDRDARLKSILTTSVNSFDYIVYENQNILESSKRMSIAKSNIYNFILTDLNNNRIDLNGSHIVFSLLVFN